MNKLSFLEGLGFALIASLAGGALFFGLSPWLGAVYVFRLLVTGVALGYLAFLLRRAPRRTGWLTALTLWCVLATLAWLFIHPLALFIAGHLGLIWMIRSLYFYRSGGAALIDLALCGLSLAAASWAFNRTGSLALGIWCLFLVQALIAMIPVDFKPKHSAEPSAAEGADRFDRACRSAEWALRKLS